MNEQTDALQLVGVEWGEGSHPFLTVLAADVLHGPGRPQLDTRSVEALQQGEERVK